MLRGIATGLWAGVLILICIGIGIRWNERAATAARLGFSGWEEQSAAYSAGYSDPYAYRSDRAKHDREREIAQREEDRRKRPTLACVGAQMTLKEKLVNPGAAKFPLCSDYPGHVTIVDTDTSWHVHSWVEVADPSGIYRQRSYEALVRYDAGSEKYHINIVRMP